MKLEWSASVDARMFGSNNPIKCGKKVLSGYNDLASASPKLSKEWNYERNGNLKPDMVTYGSGKKVWWVQYDKNPITNEIMKLEWEATVVDRFNGSGNPIKTGQKVLKGYNDLAFLNPDLAKEWNYEKNGNLKPEDVNCGSGKKVWWKLPYDVPDDYPIEHLRGRHFDFEWEAIIGNRNKGIGCPYLTGNAVWKGFNDLETLNSQLAKEWHPTKNGNLNPTDVTIGSNKKVWWLLSYDDLETGKHFDFEWQDTVNNRNNGYGCPYLSGKAAWPGFNDLQTVNPELAAQWHPIKNGNLKPTDVTIGSNRKVWWLLPYDDIKTGKHFNFEWQDTITNRIHGYACPYLSGHAVWKGFNDLQTTNPELAKQWHPTKNSNLKPTDVTAGSDKKVWWLFPYYDIKTKKHFEFEWKAEIRNRNNGCGCPYLTTYKGEEYIKQYLQKNNISFNTQQKFSDLLGTGDGQLSYDFSIPDEKYGYILIEYNGIQHYEAVDYFGGEEQFKKQKEHDKRKRDYAKKHGYKLITVKYTYDTYESIEEYLDKELKQLGVIDDTRKEESVNDAA